MFAPVRGPGGGRPLAGIALARACRNTNHLLGTSSQSSAHGVMRECQRLLTSRPSPEHDVLDFVEKTE